MLLNWTTGPVNLNHAAKVMGIQRVVTSQKFIDRVGIKIEGVEYVFLEDMRKGIGKLEALVDPARHQVFLRRRARQSAQDQARGHGRDPLHLRLGESAQGRAAHPSQHHVRRAGRRVGALGFKRGDVLLGFLPPFHSFGLSANLVLPLVGGLRVVHHADPTDAAGLVRKIAAYKPTLLFSTPTFFSYILNAAKPADLASLRIVVTGAEKCPDARFSPAPGR